LTSAAADRGSASAGGTAGTATEVPARVVFALLVAACFVAFFLTQHLKHTPTAVQAFKLTPRFSPTPAGHIKEERISFKLAHADEVTVTIVDASGGDVAVLARDVAVPRYKQVSIRWNGRRGTARRITFAAGPDGTRVLTPLIAGARAGAGSYRVRVSLRKQHRSVLSPRGFTLVRP
jgi:hypothetical protein